jgi:hypothetical protein
MFPLLDHKGTLKLPQDSKAFWCTATEEIVNVSAAKGKRFAPGASRSVQDVEGRFSAALAELQSLEFLSKSLIPQSWCLPQAVDTLCDLNNSACHALTHEVVRELHIQQALQWITV